MGMGMGIEIKRAKALRPVAHRQLSPTDHSARHNRETWGLNSTPKDAASLHLDSYTGKDRPLDKPLNDQLANQSWGAKGSARADVDLLGDQLGSSQLSINDDGTGGRN